MVSLIPRHDDFSVCGGKANHVKQVSSCEHRHSPIFKGKFMKAFSFHFDYICCCFTLLMKAKVTELNFSPRSSISQLRVCRFRSTLEFRAIHESDDWRSQKSHLSVSLLVISIRLTIALLARLSSRVLRQLHCSTCFSYDWIYFVVSAHFVINTMSNLEIQNCVGTPQIKKNNHSAFNACIA